MSGTVMLNEMINNYKARIAELEAENEKLKQCCSQRGARMQLLMIFLKSRPCYDTMGSYWDVYLKLHPEAADWFDKDGVPK